MIQHIALRQTCWGGIWCSCGLRPHEQQSLRKKHINYKTRLLTFNVPEGKTQSRVMFLEGNEAIGVWDLIKPYLDTLQDNDLLFPFTYEYANKVHKRICNRIGIPKGEAQKLYISRKMTLTHIYDVYGVSKASAMVGHVPGSNSMSAYVALNKTQLLNGIPRIAKKQCLSSNCGEPNTVERTHCVRCKAPLDKSAYEELVESSNEEQVSEVQDLKDRLARMEKHLAGVTKRVIEVST